MAGRPAWSFAYNERQRPTLIKTRHGHDEVSGTASDTNYRTFSVDTDEARCTPPPE